MTFRLVTVLYLFALLAASLTVFGVWGILVAGLVFGFWAAVSPLPDWQALAAYYRVLVVLLLIGIVVLALPDVRLRSRNTPSSNHVKQLLLGILNYESAKGHLPPAYVTDAEGRPLYSWRVAILPYIEADHFYTNDLHLDEPWDSPHNRPILDKVGASLFTSPQIRGGRDPDGTTDYVAIVDQATIWPQDKTATFRAVTDGTSNTIALLEVGGLGIHWAEPRDISLDEAVDLITGQTSNREEVLMDGYFVSNVCELRQRIGGFLDGHTETVGPLKHREDALALLTTAGGEVLPDDYELLPSTRGRCLRTIIHWDHIWGVAVWLTLVLLPSVPAARRRIWPSSKEAEVEEQELTEEAEEVYRPG